MTIEISQNSAFKLAVLKFGSSVLPSVSAIPNAVHEVYRYLRTGYKVLVVISAVGKSTEELIATAKQILNDANEKPHPQAFAELLATGETAAASLFTIALDRAGIYATKLDYKCLKTQGSYLDAEPQALNIELINNLFKQYAVLVLPGFIGVNHDGFLTLLGRGGSDFSAVFAAWALQAKQCVIYKDTQGIFSEDPNVNKNALPYQTITYEDCLKIAYPVIQHKAIKFAKEKDFTFKVQALMQTDGTLVGADRSYLGKTKSIRKLRVILLGLGTVGFGVYQYLQTNNHLFEIVGIGVKNLKKHRYLNISENIISDNLSEVIKRDCDVVIELIGGIHTSKLLITQALLQKRHVITANKALVATHSQYLTNLARQSNVNFYYSAAVAGSIPILETLSYFKKHPIFSTIKSITAILNGTSNFILDRIREGKSFAEAIKSAQIFGFAEADPSLDLNGTDAAQKLKILAQLAFDREPDVIAIEGIENLTEDYIHQETNKNNTVRLIANCELNNNKIGASVRPVSLINSHPLAHVKDANNCVVIQTITGEILELHGKGAGRWPTAEAVYADLFDIFLKHQIENHQEILPTQLQENEIGGVPYESLDTVSAF